MENLMTHFNFLSPLFSLKAMKRIRRKNCNRMKNVKQTVQTKIHSFKRLMPAQGCVDHTINNLILLQYWLKLRNKLREGVNPQQSFNVKLVPQEKTAYTKYNNYLWVVVKYYYPINPRGH